MNIKSILSKYPELDGKLIDTIDENMKLFISNEDYKLYVQVSGRPYLHVGLSGIFELPLTS